jgi:lysophospholipase L1-like esterase
MSHVSVFRLWLKRALAYFTLRRTLVRAGLFFYCLVLFLAFDFAYSNLTRGEEKQRPARIANAIYDHGLAANFDGYDVWGEVRYRLITDSLGFKDASVREVALKSASRRILLIGDSFTEGIGVSIEDSFAGMLQRAGQERSEKIEFLNAGVASYSPSIYYKKIKYLLDTGLQFDEVVLFSDTSDVTDEATSYFCIDDDPKYRVHCTAAEGSAQPGVTSPKKPNFLIDNFVVTNKVRISVKRSIQSFLGNRRKSIDTDHARIGWAVPGLPVGNDYLPLGIDGGIARSLQNMRALSDLLATRNIPLTIVVYPWAQQIAQEDRDSRQVALWSEFCPGRCKAFINLFPVFFAAADADKDWYEHLFILGDDHFSAAGHRFMFREIARGLL